MRFKNWSLISATNEFQMVIFIAPADPLIDIVPYLHATAAKRPSTKRDKVYSMKLSLLYIFL